MRPHPLVRMFAPRAVVVLGGDAPDPVARRVLENVVAGGFVGPIHAIGAGCGAGSVSGVHAHRALDTVEGPVDLAIVAPSAGEMPHAVRACGERGVAGVIVPPSFPVQPRADGREDALARDAAAEAARCGVRLLGPNSVGVIRPRARLNATFGVATANPGALGLVSQSGAICATVLDWAAARRIGFSAVVSLGDAIDVEAGEVLEYLALDRETESILLYIETIRSARKFLSGLRIAARVKPVVVVKAGRRGGCADGAPSDDAFDAALARAGAVRVASIERMFAAARLLGMRQAAGGNRLAILTNARGPGMLAADRAADLGVALPVLGADTRRALDAALPPSGSRANPLELHGDADPACFRAAVGACLADPEVDVVLAMLAPLALARPDETAEAVVAASGGARKPVIACWMGEGMVRRGRSLLVEGGIPEFGTPEGAIEAVSVLASYRQNQHLLRQVPAPAPPEAMPQAKLAWEVIRSALDRGRAALTTAELRKVLSAIGVRDRGSAGDRVTGTELRVAVVRDAVFGPIIRFGAEGGRGVDGGPVVLMPPLDTAIIETIMQTNRLAAVLGVGGEKMARDVAAIERMLFAVSELVSELPEIVELDVSRVITFRGEVYASDARVAIARAPPGAGRYDHMAIHPYPSGIGARWELPGGAVVTVRPIRPEDAEMEASFVRNLSDDTRHFRFMVGLKELPREMLIRLTQIDYDRELALVALVQKGGRELEIAVARYAMAPDARSADVAIVVADEWQRRGIGTRLFQMLIDAARARGIPRLEGEMLADNAQVRSLVTRFGFSLRPDPESGDVYLIEKTLG